MRNILIILGILLANVSQRATADQIFLPDNVETEHHQQRRVVQERPVYSDYGCKDESKNMVIKTNHHVRHRPLTAEEQRFLSTFPEYVHNGSFGIRQAVYEMLVTDPPVIHVNRLGFDPTGRDPSRNALHYVTLYQAWLGPHEVKVPIIKPKPCPPFSEVGPAPKQPGLCLEPVPIVEVPCPQPVPRPPACPSAPVIRQLGGTIPERLPERQIFPPVPQTGLGLWWHQRPALLPAQPCPPGTAPEPPPPSEAFPDLPPGVHPPGYPHYPGDILNPGEPVPPWAPPPPLPTGSGLFK